MFYMCITPHNQMNDSGDHSLKRESIQNSWVSKGTEKRILFLGTGIVGHSFLIKLINEDE
jgi:hypothetical protein